VLKTNGANGRKKTAIKNHQEGGFLDSKVKANQDQDQ
jgi:hypothetical protein